MICNKSDLKILPTNQIVERQEQMKSDCCNSIPNTSKLECYNSDTSRVVAASATVTDISHKKFKNKCRHGKHFNYLIGNTSFDELKANGIRSIIPLLQAGIKIFIVGIAMLIIFVHNQQKFNSKEVFRKIGLDTFIQDDPNSCLMTCKVEIVESVPQNLTFTNGPTSLSTFEAWLKLIKVAKYRLSIAAYKSSLRGSHVFGNTTQQFSSQGEIIYDALVEAGLKRHVKIRVVENNPSKDKGDNEDAIQLHKIGAITRKALNLQKVYNSGVMHSKFIIADMKHFYLGSANLDWRSLNQKMELGVYVSDCPCLAKDLNSLFEVYWRIADAKASTDVAKIVEQQTAVRFNAGNPLKMQVGEQGINTFLAASPLFMNAPSRSWDLDAIVNAISSAKTFVNIHVMDYFPMFMYGRDRRFWPAIDNAIRGAITRGVNVKILAAALHYPKISLRFLESLESLGKMPNTGRVYIKILKVPSSASLQNVIKRDRRTHKKFLVSDDQTIIGTSNWSGDYFEAKSTGIAMVIRKDGTQRSHNLIEKMCAIFNRDWNSIYSHSLRDYVRTCLEPQSTTQNNATKSFDTSYCEPEKDLSLLASPSIQI